VRAARGVLLQEACAVVSTSGPQGAKSGNRLAGEASSYLRSAAHQPVDWFPWGPEAFEKAKREDKPILLDIGAVWCHWCHVMDGESYENAETARLINDHFIPVKVDRDERPDVDARYQPAVAALSGGGGWPLTAFLTPAGLVFSGGTYFPPKDMYGRPGFPKVLRTIADAYRTKKDQLLDQAQQITDALQRSGDAKSVPGKVAWGLVKKALDSALMNFDIRHGGFGDAPKFPHASAVELALTEVSQAGDESLKTVVEVTLTRMAQGGFADQIGGGFHRYSTDAEWVVPHFEKMLYDNCELLRNYSHAFQVMGDPYFGEVARGTVEYMDRVLTDRARGGFFASQDADVGAGDDGDYWTWTNRELEEALGKGTELYQVAAAHYDVQPAGEMHHNAAKNVLWVAVSFEELARRLKKGEKEVQGVVAEAKRKLLAARAMRDAPFVDTTIYTSWNGLAISAYIEAWKALRLESCKAFAVKTAEFLLESCYDPTRGMAHQWRKETGARVWGLLDDQAMFALGLLDVFEATQEPRYLETARRLADLLIERFADDDGGLLDVAPSIHDAGGSEALKAKVKPFQDAPTPAGNPIAAVLLDRLEALLGEARYREAAARILESFAAAAPRYGIFAGTFAAAVRLHLERPVHVTIVGDEASAKTLALFDAAVRSFPPHKAVVMIAPGAEPPAGFPESARDFAKGYPADKLPAACVCKGTHCNIPTSDPAVLVKQVSAPPAA
jgi:uncharacterized protein YyaL (SSP411 family)